MMVGGVFKMHRYRINLDEDEDDEYRTNLC